MTFCVAAQYSSQKPAVIKEFKDFTSSAEVKFMRAFEDCM